MEVNRGRTGRATMDDLEARLTDMITIVLSGTGF